MRSLKSLRQIGAELASVHGATAEYGQRAVAAYFRQLPAYRSLAWCKSCRAANPAPAPGAGQRIIADAVTYYPENLTVGDVRALGDAP